MVGRLRGDGVDSQQTDGSSEGTAGLVVVPLAMAVFPPDVHLPRAQPASPAVAVIDVGEHPGPMSVVPAAGGIGLVSFQIPAMASVDGLCDLGEEPPGPAARIWARSLLGVALNSLDGSGGILVGRCVHRRLVLHNAAASRKLRAPPELDAGLRSSPGCAPHHRAAALRAVRDRLRRLGPRSAHESLSFVGCSSLLPDLLFAHTPPTSASAPVPVWRQRLVGRPDLGAEAREFRGRVSPLMGTVGV